MKKRIVSLILSLVMVLTLIPFMGGMAFASDESDLPELQNVQISEDGILSWDAFPGAAEYWITWITGSKIGRTTVTKYNLKTPLENDGNESGDYIIEVCAKDADLNVISKSWRGTYSYTVVTPKPKLATPTNLTFDENTISWDAVADATAYSVVFYANDTWNDLGNLTSTSYNVEDYLINGENRNCYFSVSAQAEGYVRSETATSATVKLYKKTLLEEFSVTTDCSRIEFTDNGTADWPKFIISPENSAEVNYGSTRWVTQDSAGDYYVATDPTSKFSIGSYKLHCVFLVESTKYKMGEYVKINLDGETINAAVDDSEIGSDSIYYYISVYPEATRTIDHAWDEGVITTPATCVADGVKTYTCKACEKTKTEVIPMGPGIHSYDEGVITTPATCVADGVKTYTCGECGDIKTDTIPMDPEAHDWNVALTPATFGVDGSKTTTCSLCTKTTTTETIRGIADCYLGGTSHPYTGKTIKPFVWADDGVDELVINKDFEITRPSTCKAVGTYSITVKFKGNYTGTVKKTYKVVPAKPIIKSMTVGTRKLTVKMSSKPSVKGASTYQIAYKQKGTSKWKYVTTTSTSKTLSKLKKGKQYYVKVRAYKTVSGKKYYGAWTAAKLSKKIK